VNQPQYHLAQINIGRTLGTMDSAIMAEFKANLDPINALAERTPGFVWRLKSDDGNDATSIHVYEDDYLLINMSVWESVEALRGYTYNSAHTDFVRRRAQWFEKLKEQIFALWWIPAGHIPTPQEGKEKLQYLREHGATPLVFTFTQRFTVEDMLAYVEQQREI
jgi:hypothetical protein